MCINASYISIYTYRHTHYPHTWKNGIIKCVYTIHSTAQYRIWLLFCYIQTHKYTFLHTYSSIYQSVIVISPNNNNNNQLYMCVNVTIYATIRMYLGWKLTIAIECGILLSLQMKTEIRFIVKMVMCAAIQHSVFLLHIL